MGNFTENKIILLSQILLILRGTERDMVKNMYWSSGKVPLFLSDLNKT
jgi:hypothetical protein